MISFTLVTPVTYWVLIGLWGYILYFFFRQRQDIGRAGHAISILLSVLAVDAFRSLFESVYFGAWQSARAGFLPYEIFGFLGQPELVIIPKLFDLLVASLIVILLIKRFIPSIAEEQKRSSEQIAAFEFEVAEHKRTADLLRGSEMRNRALLEGSSVCNKIIDLDSRLV